MKVKAIFTGESSLGYKKGSGYVLEIKDLDGVIIKREDGSGVCKYTSIYAFFRNWTNVTLINN